MNRILSLCLLSSSAVAFTTTSTTTSTSRHATLLQATTVQPPERKAPGAGYVPEWENRPGLAPEEFLASDMTKPDLGADMWECPLTRWDYKK